MGTSWNNYGNKDALFNCERKLLVCTYVPLPELCRLGIQFGVVVQSVTCTPES
jgi:hypothetical protein